MSGAMGSDNSSSDGSIERCDHSRTGSLSRSYESSGPGAAPSDGAAAYETVSSVTMTPLVCERNVRNSESSNSSRPSSSSESSARVADLEMVSSLFQKQSEKEVTDSEELRELNKRVDPELLTQVQEYDEVVPSEAASYGKAAFWDERYSRDEEVVEWYQPWVNLAPTLTQYIDKKDEILVCGCGNSEMSVDMFDDGFEHITNVDISRVVIDQMRQTYEAYPVEWRPSDLTHKVFPEERFDVALDKACLDSIICGFNGAWMADRYLQQIDRILRPDGAFICISHVGPEERLELLEYWDLDTPEKCLTWDVYVDSIQYKDVFFCSPFCLNGSILAKDERYLMLRRPSPRKPELEKGENLRPGDDSFYYVYVCIKDPTKTEQKMSKKKERLKHEQDKSKVSAAKRGWGLRYARRRGRR